MKLGGPPPIGGGGGHHDSGYPPSFATVFLTFLAATRALLAAAASMITVASLGSFLRYAIHETTLRMAVGMTTSFRKNAIAGTRPSSSITRGFGFIPSPCSDRYPSCTAHEISAEAVWDPTSNRPDVPEVPLRADKEKAYQFMRDGSSAKIQLNSKKPKRQGSTI